jgi:LPS sulfotransferase NodH
VSQIRFICTFATARTGSNRMQSLMANCQGLNLKAELFHRETIWAWSEEDIEAVAARAETEDDQELRTWRADHPGETLDILYESGGERLLVFKIFPHHLRRDVICRDLFSRDDIAFSMLRRRPIESYISLMKARKSKIYDTVDTTTFHPVLNAKQFVTWALQTRDWYYWLSDEFRTRGIPCADLSYEREVGIDDPEEALSRILSILGDQGIPDLKLKRKPVSGLQKQDKEENYKNRVANWDEFAAELDSETLHAHLLPWAEGKTV